MAVRRTLADGFPVSWLWGREKLAARRQALHLRMRLLRQTDLTAGTILHGSKLPLTVWFWASYLMSTHSNGISALQLQKQLAFGSYKTAWLLAAKLRRAMTSPDRGPLAGIVEIDETTLPLRGKDEPLTGGGGGAHARAKCSSPARLRSMETARGAFVSERSRTSPPRRCMVSSPPMWRKARRSSLTVGPPIPARPASITILMSSAPWPLMSCCQRMQTPEYGRRRRLPSSPPDNRPQNRRPSAAIKSEKVDLALDATDDFDGFTEVYLSMPRRMLQRHEHLLSPPMPASHIILHNRDAACETVFVPKPLEDPLRGMLLLLRTRLVVQENAINHENKWIKLWPSRRLLAHVTWRHRELHHLGDCPRVRASCERSHLSENYLSNNTS